jgi:transcription-repair coupling factor (superfamily II helicase)
MGRLRLLAENAGVKAIDIVEDRLQFRFHEDAPVEPERLIELMQREQGSLSPSGALRLPAPPRGADRVASAAELLRRIIGESVL